MFTDFRYFRYSIFGIFRFGSFRFASKKFRFVSKRNQPVFSRYFASLIFAFVMLRFASKQNEGNPRNGSILLWRLFTFPIFLLFIYVLAYPVINNTVGAKSLGRFLKKLLTYIRDNIFSHTEEIEKQSFRLQTHRVFMGLNAVGSKSQGIFKGRFLKKKKMPHSILL